jgi:hypothetical protein
MVHSSTPIVTTDGESLTCGGFSLNETICFGSLEFIANYFGSLSLSGTQRCKGTSFFQYICMICVYLQYNFSKRKIKWKVGWLRVTGVVAGQSFSPKDRRGRRAPLACVLE